MTPARTFVGPTHRFDASLSLPGDKSLSHRALILAAMARGDSHLAGLGTGADVASTIRCLRAFGVVVADDGALRSPGIHDWTQPGATLDAGNSGTTLRMLTGAVSGRPFTTTLSGDTSLRLRPMRRLVDPLRALGATVDVSTEGTAPVTVHGTALVGAEVWIPVASAQVRTAFALAALQADGESRLDSPPGFRNHTERWLTTLGLGRAIGPAGFLVQPGLVPELDLTIPGDPSSAAFLWTAAALTASRVTTPGVSLNPGRTGLLDVMTAMGATVEVIVTGDILGDPVGTVTVEGPVQHGMRIEGSLMVRTLDELPLVGLLGSVSDGETVVADAAELREKESDRIAATVGLVNALGGDAAATPDGFIVRSAVLRSGTFDGAGDHRMAMASAVAATITGTVVVIGMEAASVSWPGFAEALERVWSSR